MNDILFQDLVRGEYGRKIAYADYDTVTPLNAVEIVSKGVTTLNMNRPSIRYLWNYYKGDQPIRYRKKIVRDDVVNRIVENHAYEFVQFNVSQSYGEPIQCISRKDDEIINNAVDNLNDYLKDAFKPARDVSCSEWVYATGQGYEAVIDLKGKDNDIPFGIIVPDPLNTIVVYSSITQLPLLGMQCIKIDGKNAYQCYSETHQFVVFNSQIFGDYKLHGFGGIPIVEKYVNSSRLSSIELCIDLFDAINNYQSNRMDSIEQFVQSFMKFINCEIDKDTFAEMKKQGAFMIKSNNGDNKADVDIMQQELKQSESQIAKQDLLDNALVISAIPSKEGGNKSGDSQGAVELRAGWNFAKGRAKLREPYIIECEKRLIKVILNIIRIRKGNTECPISNRDYDIVIMQTPNDNLVVRCQALQYLLQCGIHPLIALKTCGLFGDVEKVFALSKPYLDNLYKTVDMAQEEEAKKLYEDFQRKQATTE